MGFSRQFGRRRSVETCCPVLELRQYTLYSNQRDILIDLFDREFVESQEAVGMRIVGQFRDLDDPDRFVWVRGFRDMDSRAEALKAFYGGPIWEVHRDDANATMVDSSNALLLKPAVPTSGFSLTGATRPPAGVDERPTSCVLATIYDRAAPVDDNFIRFFERRVKPLMTQVGARPLAYLQTDTADNTFPALPVRTGENLFIWFASFRDIEQLRHHARRLIQSKAWNKTILPELLTHLRIPPVQLRLQPTARSLLR
jgi:hypothetical protein